MKRTRQQGSRSNGWTVIELVVVVSIIGLLVSLAMPSLVSATAAARSVQCSSRLKQLTLSVLQRHDTHASFPNAHLRYRDQRSYNWVVSILPWIEQSALYDQLSDANYDWGDRDTPEIVLLTCPSDTTLTGTGNLSYGANCGLVQSHNIFRRNVPTISQLDMFHRTIDLNGDGSKEYGFTDRRFEDSRHIEYCTRVFALVRDPDWFLYAGEKRGSPQHSISSLTDGASNTILLGENIRNGVDPLSDKSGWLRATESRLSITTSSEICPDGHCFAGSIDMKRASNVNTGLDLPEGFAPWLNSQHSGGAYVGFGDGHVDFLNSEVHGKVLFQLMSPRDSQLDETVFGRHVY